MPIGLCLDYFGVKLEWTTHLARVNYNVLNMCHAYIHYCSYNYLILVLFVYMMFTIEAVCVCVCVKQESKRKHRSGGK